MTAQSKPTPPNVWGGKGFEVGHDDEGPGAIPKYCVHVNGVGSWPIAWFYEEVDAILWAETMNAHFSADGALERQEPDAKAIDGEVEGTDSLRPSSMVERVARIICSADRSRTCDTVCGGGVGHCLAVRPDEQFFLTARAAILAMREPTGAMVEAGRARVFQDRMGDKSVARTKAGVAVDVFTLMINEALKDG